MSTEIKIVAVEVGRHVGPAAVQAAITAQKAASYTTVVAAIPYKWYDLDYVILVFSKGNVLHSAGRTAVGATFASNEFEIAVDSTGLTQLQTWMIARFDQGTSLTKVHFLNLVERQSKMYAVVAMSN